MEATFGALDAQVYEQVGVVVVGAEDIPEATVAGRRVVGRDTLQDVLGSLPSHVSHVWFVLEGAKPRPDAAKLLLEDMDRTGAAIAGSKIVRGASENLVSVGLITDVFGDPYTGLDSQERDQGQYDVVRDIAAVAGVSMMVRRDLLNGLHGLDPDMPIRPAAVDCCQRARLKGARIVVCPASVVDYPAPEERAPRWREEAGRIRSMLKVYGPLTLLWAIPLDFLAGLLEAVVSIFLGRWLVFDFIKSWSWNVARFPSTLSARRAARTGRVAGDPELFRYQRRGSVRLARLGKAVATTLRRRLPGDDRLSVESIGNDVRQPAFIVGILAVLFVLLSSRNIWADGFPSVGFTLPFPGDGWDSLSAYAGGWNPAGLGSPAPLRPLIAIASLLKIVTFNSDVLAEYLAVAGSLLFGIWGTTRLLRTWSIPATPALVAGVVYVAGPTAQGIAGNTTLGTVLAIGVLPWAFRICLAPLDDGLWPGIRKLTVTVLLFGLLGALSPLLLLVPAPALLLYALLRWNEERGWRAVILAIAGTGFGALLLSPWIWTAALRGVARAGFAYWEIAPFIAISGAAIVVAATIGARKGLGVVVGWAATLVGVGFLGSRSGDFGFGTEFESAALAVAGLGLAVLIGALSDGVSSPDVERWRRGVLGIGAVGVVVFVVGALTIVLGGRAGLPGDVYGETLEFASANPGEAERARVLLVGPSDLMPGDSRSIDGGAYRVVSASGPDLGEARLAAPLEFDDLLDTKLRAIIDGDTSRAGGELATFGVHWIVVMGDSAGNDADETSLAWRNVFAGQLDLLPLSTSTGNATFVSDVSPVGRALTSGQSSWARVGWTYEGDAEPGGSVFVAENSDPGFGPGPRESVGGMNTVSAETGVVTYAADATRRLQASLSGIAVLLLIGIAYVARRRS